MTKKETITLKILGPVITVLYGWSLLWISVMYLYGAIYVPLRDLDLHKSIYFEIFVTALTLITVAIVFNAKGRTFLELLLQDIVLIIVLVPFFGLMMGALVTGFDDPGGLLRVYAAMFLLTVVVINVNDWLKTKNPERTAAMPHDIRT